MATVGYGDLTARSSIGRMTAALEGLLGQLYLVTVVALLVSNLGQERSFRGPGDRERATRADYSTAVSSERRTSHSETSDSSGSTTGVNSRGGRRLAETPFHIAISSRPNSASSGTPTASAMTQARVWSVPTISSAPA